MQKTTGDGSYNGLMAFNDSKTRDVKRDKYIGKEEHPFFKG